MLLLAAGGLPVIWPVHCSLHLPRRPDVQQWSVQGMKLSTHAVTACEHAPSWQACAANTVVVLLAGSLCQWCTVHIFLCLPRKYAHVLCRELRSAPLGQHLPGEKCWVGEARWSRLHCNVNADPTRPNRIVFLGVKCMCEAYLRCQKSIHGDPCHRAMPAANLQHRGRSVRARAMCVPGQAAVRPQVSVGSEFEHRSVCLPKLHVKRAAGKAGGCANPSILPHTHPRSLPAQGQHLQAQLRDWALHRLVHMPERRARLRPHL